MLMSKKTYVGIYATSFGLCQLTITALGALFVFGFVQRSDRALNQAIGYASGFGFFAYLQLVVVHAVYNFVLLARMWRTIQDGQTTVTVRRAIGFLFMPFFNVYWIFRAWGSFPGEYNRYVDRYDLPVALLPGRFSSLIRFCCCSPEFYTSRSSRCRSFFSTSFPTSAAPSTGSTRQCASGAMKCRRTKRRIIYTAGN